MLRTIVYLLATVLVISFLRGVLGLISRGVSDLFQSENQQKARSQASPNTVGMGGELVKDPACGMYVSPAVALKKQVKGQTHYFCSEACRDKFPA